MARKPLRATPTDGSTIPLDSALRNADDNFIELYASGGGGGGAVDSVNGQTGVVVLDKSDVGLGNVDNTSDANKPVSSATTTALGGKQPIDSDLTDIAALTPSNDDVLQRKAGAWTNRTLAQVKADAGLNNVDNTSNATERAAVATLTNKTISGANNTLSAIGNNSLTNSAVTLNGASLSLGGTRTLGLASADFVNQGTTATVLHGNAAGNPSFGAVSLTADISGVLPLANTDLSTARTWTGVHTWNLAEPRLLLSESDQAADLKVWDLDVQAGVFSLRTRTDADAAGKNALAVTRGATTAVSNVAFGNATDNNTFTFLGNGTTTFGSGAVNGILTLTVTGQASLGRVNLTSSTVTANGLHLPGTNRLGFSTNSTYRGEFDAAGQLKVGTVGAGLSIAEGSNAKMGVATLVGGTVVVSTTAVTASSRILLTPQSLGTVSVPSGYGVSARTAGTSFTILSSVPTDTSVIAWMIVEPS